jgi:hypothetical protein
MKYECEPVSPTPYVPFTCLLYIVLAHLDIYLVLFLVPYSYAIVMQYSNASPRKEHTEFAP